MNRVEKKIMRLFAEKGIACEGMLTVREIVHATYHWAQEDCAELILAVESLEGMGYIRKALEGLRLTTKGYEALSTHRLDTANEKPEIRPILLL